ncbi:MAG: tetratricopeptide repeat protein [Nitrospirae bacterium]|nr:tetratricopeptide repeat protein [Nitrospirota bacterium]
MRNESIEKKLISSYFKVGTVYYESMRYNEAIEYFNRAMYLAKEQKDKNSESIAKANVEEIERKLNQ